MRAVHSTLLATLLAAGWVNQRTAASTASPALRGASSRSDGASELVMVKIIEESFAHIQGPGEVLKVDSPKGVAAIDSEEFLFTCLTPEITSKQVGDKLLLDLIYEAVGITDRCASDSMTCQAIVAAQRAMARLEASFPQGPKFVNYTLVNWRNSSGPASWRNGSVSLQTPSAAAVLDANGGNAYALCEFTRLIVQQSAHQRASNVCGWTALLEMAAWKAPAQLFKKAVQLFWTGRLSSSRLAMPCDYLFHLQPGLTAITMGEPFGLEAMWTYSLLSAERQRADIACSGDGISMNSASGQMSPTTALYEQSTPGMLKNTAEILFDNKARVLTNEATCPQEVDLQLCQTLRSADIFAFGALLLIHNDAGFTSPYVEATLMQVKQYTANIEIGFSAILSMLTPGATKSMLEEGCDAAKTPGTGTVLLIDEAILYGKAPGSQCDHHVVIHSCSSDLSEVTVWTWGGTVTLAMTNITGGACAALITNVSLN